MKKKLYVVDLTHTVYVMAVSESEAEVVAKKGVLEYGERPEAVVNEVGKSPVPKVWLDGIPFGGDDDRTVAQIIGRSKI